MINPLEQAQLLGRAAATLAITPESATKELKASTRQGRTWAEEAWAAFRG